MGRNDYAGSAEKARAFRTAIRTYLVCPACAEYCMDVKRSKTAVVMRCTCCGLRWHMRRCDLADSVRRRVEDAPKGEEREALARLAQLFAPPGGPAYEDWRRHTQWTDPTLARPACLACLDCRTRTTNPTRCTPCSTAHTTAHRTARHRAAPYVDTGLTRCSRCGHPIHPGEAWDIDRRASGWAPAHRACNRAPAAGAGGRA